MRGLLWGSCKRLGWLDPTPGLFQPPPVAQASSPEKDNSQLLYMTASYVFHINSKCTNLAPDVFCQTPRVHSLNAWDSLLRQPSVQTPLVVPVAGKVAELPHHKAVGPNTPRFEKAAHAHIVSVELKCTLRRMLPY